MIMKVRLVNETGMDNVNTSLVFHKYIQCNIASDFKDLQYSYCNMDNIQIRIFINLNFVHKMELWWPYGYRCENVDNAKPTSWTKVKN